MASSVPNRSLAARAAAILTTGEVAGASLDVNESAPGGALVVDHTFTLGSLTNVILRGYVSDDGSTWRPLREGAAGTLVSLTLTATESGSWVIPVPNGKKWFRVTAQGTGTVTSSSLALTYRFVKRGTN